MKKRLIAIAVSLSILASLLATGIVLADWQGGYWALKSYDIDWSQYGDTGWTAHDAEWSMYWDSEQGRYTQYRLETDGYGYVEVNGGSNVGVSREDVAVYDYQGSPTAYNATYWDVVNPGYFWKYYYPAIPVTLTKPSSGTDITELTWRYRWDRVIPPWGWHPSDRTEFFYSSQQFYHGHGLN